MNAILTSILMGLAQTALAALGGIFVAHHWITGEQEKTFIASGLKHAEIYAPIAGALALTMWQKRVSIIRQLVSLMPGIHTMQDVDAYMASGKPKPTIFTPPSTTPGVPLTKVTP